MTLIHVRPCFEHGTYQNYLWVVLRIARQRCEQSICPPLAGLHSCYEGACGFQQQVGSMISGKAWFPGVPDILFQLSHLSQPHWWQALTRISREIACSTARVFCKMPWSGNSQVNRGFPGKPPSPYFMFMAGKMWLARLETRKISTIGWMEQLCTRNHHNLAGNTMGSCDISPNPQTLDVWFAGASVRCEDPHPEALHLSRPIWGLLGIYRIRWTSVLVASCSFGHYNNWGKGSGTSKNYPPVIKLGLLL
jgi:hypothetical protein